MTALGLAMGVSTLTLTLWYRVPVLTAWWELPGAALLVTGLQGLTLNEAIGVFIVTNALLASGITGLFARLMRIIPHSLAAATLAGILLRFGLQAFASLDGQFTLCGSICWYGGNQGRCAALCGNCRDDYWDRDRYRAR